MNAFRLIRTIERDRQDAVSFGDLNVFVHASVVQTRSQFNCQRQWPLEATPLNSAFRLFT